STPETRLELSTGTPVLHVKPDHSQTIRSVDVFYTTQGKPDERPEDRLSTMHRFWHHATASQVGDSWRASLPLSTIDAPLWAYANVRYSLDGPVRGAGYYYGTYTADSFNLSSLLVTASATNLRGAGVHPTMERQNLIEDFGEGWEREWFIYSNDPKAWQRRTNKLNADIHQAPAGATLAFDVQSAEPNTLVVRLDQSVSEVDVRGGDWQTIRLKPNDFRDADEVAGENWKSARQFGFSDIVRLRKSGGGKPVTFGAPWKGLAPQFRNLRWIPSE
ncbi:MAG: hypothetical protein AAFU85_34530, partial [Planctomycetota bacterium]